MGSYLTIGLAFYLIMLGLIHAKLFDYDKIWTDTPPMVVFCLFLCVWPVMLFIAGCIGANKGLIALLAYCKDAE